LTETWDKRIIPRGKWGELKANVSKAKGFESDQEGGTEDKEARWKRR
jgi:hypothetical protein